MSLGANVYQTLVLTVLAAITTVITTSLTYYLLSRPWCIEITVSGGHTILYGAENCDEDTYHHASPHAVSEASIGSILLD